MKNKKSAFLVLLVLAWAVYCVPGYEEVASYVWNSAGKPVVVVDAGHGGMDGGAESSDGTAEKDINLRIAQLLQEQLEEQDIRVIMTRETEGALYEGTSDESIRSRKTQDMYARKALIDETSAALTVSIHLNSFPQDPSVRGAQVFYPSGGESSAESETAAEIVQQGLNQQVNVEKQRAALGKDDVLLLREAASPIVIVECGFLSNQEEAIHLKKEAYQEKIAKTLSDSIVQYLQQKEQNNQKSFDER